MNNNNISEIVGGVFTLKAESFLSIVNLPQGLWLAILVVLVAGVSLGIGQGIILFISRVKPVRFIFSLLLNGILFTFGFLFLVFSTWLNCQFPWSSLDISFLTLIRVLGLSYAPSLFSFLGALPYLGVPILSILSVWRFLAMVVGFSAVTGVSIPGAFNYLIFGWLVLQLLENTLGKPIAKFGKTITNKVAGVEVVDSRSELREKLQSGIQEVANPIIASSLPRQTPQATSGYPTTPVKTVEKNNLKSPPVTIQENTIIKPQTIKLILSLVGMVILFLVIAWLLRPIRQSILGWLENLPSFVRLIVNLTWIGVIATVFAGLLAPLETLGWWAGWYEDKLETDNSVDFPSQDNSVTRYVVYLDGIGQSGSEYTPDVECFLNALRSVIPEKMKLIQGIMMYSVLNKPLDEARPLAFFWRIADRMRFANPKAVLGLFVNLRNVLIVAVSADKRYGPIYNQGIAQNLYNGLRQQGYQPDSGIPITLIGYSGGGEMSVAAAPYLTKTLRCPIDVISLGGVMSANNNFLELEHLYHLVGDKDDVERIGPIIFPGRWKLFVLSYWNRAKRLGKITIFSLGPVGHQVPGGMMDPDVYLPDGRSYLEQTIGVILEILQGKALKAEPTRPRLKSNYQLYQEAAFIHPEYYPIQQNIDNHLYRPVGDWIGRLILPQLEEREEVGGAWLEIRHAPPEYQNLLGKKVKLRWSKDPFIQKQVKAVTKDIHFSAQAEYSSKYEGLIHPDRLNHWRQVDPLESLAGSRPNDDVMVSLSRDGVMVEDDCLYTSVQPLQITGLYYGVVRFIAPLPDTDSFRVQHFYRESRDFDGPEEIISLPEVIADVNGCFPSTTKEIEKSPLNEQGWYIYGAKDHQGVFVVQSLIPRAIWKLEPQQLIINAKQGYKFIRQQAWSDTIAPKGKIASVLISPKDTGVTEWREGERALVIHVYGGIGGRKREPAAATPIFFGHFAYGLAKVIKEPLTEELRFEQVYDQVYTHNSDGLTAGILHWSRYMGDRQFGWAGVRPVCDLLIKFDPLTSYYNINGKLISPLDNMLLQLSVMTARYRTGDGTGGTYVGPANNCSQDSNRALFASIQYIYNILNENRELTDELLTENSEQARNLSKLLKLGTELRQVLEPFGRPRQDWQNNEFNLGSTLEDKPLINLWTGLGSWRTMLPRCASDNIVRIFLKYGATVWVLRTNQIGGYDPDIEAIAPITI